MANASQLSLTGIFYGFFALCCCGLGFTQRSLRAKQGENELGA